MTPSSSVTKACSLVQIVTGATCLCPVIQSATLTLLCEEGAARKRHRLAQAASVEAALVVFDVRGEEIENVSTFKYLGRLISSTDNDWPARYKNLREAWQCWAKLSRLLVRDGASPRISGMFYKAVVRSTLFFSSETWIITRPMLKALEGFHNRVACRLTGKMPRLLIVESCFYPPMADALHEAGLYPISHNVKLRRIQYPTSGKSPVGTDPQSLHYG